MAEPSTLAVVAPFLGLPSETFVRRHATELAPGRTVGVVTDMPRPGPDLWGGDVSTRVVAGRALPSRRRMQVARKLAAVRGRPAGRWRWAPTAAAEEDLARDLAAAGVGPILVEFLDVWLSAAETLRRSAETLVVHGHGYDVSSRLTDPWWREQYLRWRSADAIVVVADHSRRRLAALGLDEDRLHVIPCAVEVPSARPAPPTPQDRETVEVVAVGRLVEKKGSLRTLAAFAAAHRRIPELRLTMVGDGPLAAAAAAFVREHDLGAAVTLLGVQPPEEVHRQLARADLFVQHSLTVPSTGEEEGLPVAVLEAMAAGLPVVSTRHAGIPEAVVHGTTGLLVDEGDVDGMADALVELARDRAARARLGHAGWQRAGERFSVEREVTDLRAVLGLPVS